MPPRGPAFPRHEAGEEGGEATTLGITCPHPEVTDAAAIGISLVQVRCMAAPNGKGWGRQSPISER